jgi:hypothetical protein
MVEDTTRILPMEPPEITLAQEIAELVREHSLDHAILTPMASLEVDEKPLEPEERERLVQEVLADPECGDLRLLRTSKGAAYFYSTLHMSDGYARILLRVEEDNPYETIAATVREESELYPRPTPIAALRNPTFGLEADRVEQLAREVVQLEQYKDIKLIEASTGAIYLHSDRFLDAEWARSLVEWEEVGKNQSM